MIPGLGIWELILILLIVLFFFGAKRIPVIGRGIGAGIRNFKSAIRGDDGPPSDRTLEEPPDNDRA
jgi:sec-independent protein translocase protein TatA